MYGHLENNAIKAAKNPALIDGAIVINPTAAMYLKCDPPEKEVNTAAPTDPAPEGYHYEADGWDETETTITRRWKTVEDAKVVRVFSKLKCYAALKGAGYWDTVKSWLEANDLWDAFVLAQDVREDNEQFEAGLAAIKSALGLTDEQADAILANCVAED